MALQLLIWSTSFPLDVCLSPSDSLGCSFSSVVRTRNSALHQACLTAAVEIMRSISNAGNWLSAARYEKYAEKLHNGNRNVPVTIKGDNLSSAHHSCTEMHVVSTGPGACLPLLLS